MRAAEDYINKYWVHPTDLLKGIPNMINEARKEVIEECAEKAQLKINTGKAHQ